MPLKPLTELRRQARCSRAQMSMLPRARAKPVPIGSQLLPAVMAMSVPLAGVLVAIGISRLV